MRFASSLPTKIFGILPVYTFRFFKNKERQLRIVE